MDRLGEAEDIHRLMIHRLDEERKTTVIAYQEITNLAVNQQPTIFTVALTASLRLALWQFEPTAAEIQVFGEFAPFRTVKHVGMETVDDKASLLFILD